ncbi:putative nucleolar MIF4G domain-containing protein 1, incomplete match [Sciurus carolinensis]|uniref:Nucleolar MIF4G domain-containing protein 1, incomplete match n=1 Tax=Sciurus carolinensis TaxID=30640 RepID=A0AA41MV27_SCICA|nr:putative nucleolar MIF4G domain-containing protein 1, incomplete match [Sciurus carolinensis]
MLGSRGEGEDDVGAPHPESDLESDSEPQSEEEDAEDAVQLEEDQDVGPESCQEPEGGARESAGRKSPFCRRQRKE